MLAYRESVLAGDAEIGGGAEVLSIDENAGAARIDFGLQLALPGLPSQGEPGSAVVDGIQGSLRPSTC